MAVSDRIEPFGARMRAVSDAVKPMDGIDAHSPTL